MAVTASSQQSGQPAGESKPLPTTQAVPEKPARAPSLDAFLQQQKEGKLADAVREKTKECN
jgi:hypothetical protein